MKRSILLLAPSSVAIAMACSSPTTTDDGGPPDSTTDVAQKDSSTDGTGGDSGNDGSSKDAASDSSDGSNDAGGDASDASAQFTLTVRDYLSWCKVTVNGGSPSTTDPQIYKFAPNTSVTAQGDTANASVFYWGYWGNVAADGGLADGGTDTSKTVSFTITRDMTLLACCPDNNQPLTQCTF